MASEVGFIKLYDPDGREVAASLEDLLAIEAMDGDVARHRRLAGDRSGRYWLISNRPGFHALLLRVSIFQHHPRPNPDWSISYGLTGVASYADFNVESAITTFSRVYSPSPSDGDKALPANVADLARQHVAYRLGKTPGPDPLDTHGVRTRDAVDMRRLIGEFTGYTVNPTELIRRVAGRRVHITELLLEALMFCARHDIDERDGEMLHILVPEDQREHLAKLLNKLGPG